MNNDNVIYKTLFPEYIENGTKMTPLSIQILAVKDIFMLFLLHLNEDFDDDLLLDYMALLPWHSWLINQSNIIYCLQLIIFIPEINHSDLILTPVDVVKTSQSNVILFCIKNKQT